MSNDVQRAKRLVDAYVLAGGSLRMLAGAIGTHHQHISRLMNDGPTYQSLVDKILGANLKEVTKALVAVKKWRKKCK